MILRTEARTSRAAARGGFTLMEVLVVVAILVIMAGTGGVIYMNYLNKAKIDRAKMDVQSLTTAVMAYDVSYGSMPASLQQLTQRMPDGSPATVEVGQLLDPWNQPYQYNPQGQHHGMTGKPDIWSNGPPNSANSQMIGNWSNNGPQGF
jgi:general secretion pathway protein G